MMLKSSSYYSRKAWDAINCGHWAVADEFKRLAAKARKAEAKKRKAKAAG